LQLFKPVKVGSMDLKNRICMPAIHHAYTPDGMVNDKLVEYYRARAEGGAAFITVGGCTVDELGGGPAMIGLHEDKFIPGMERLASVIKDAGAYAGVQLYQAGRYTHSIMTGGIQPIAPSPIASRLTREEPREMTLEDIETVQENFAAAALRAKKAGFNAVEIIASAGYLICQFLSPLTNQRNDEYGGSWENRCRFGVEVVKKVKERLGEDVTLLVRLSGNDYMPGSNTNEEAAAFAVELEKAGVDCFNVTGGWHETRVPQITGDLPRGGFAYLARGIKEAVSVPVIASNRINDPGVAEKILREDQADLINMGRPLIADPWLPEKTRNGKTGSIRKCIACNQGCLDMVFTMQELHCAVNPLAGREHEVNITNAESPAKVLVVGGGPAGMQAAVTAASRGHQVTLWEKEGQLGGQLHYACLPPGKQEFITLVDYLRNRLEETGVKVELNREASRENIRDFGADKVVLASGAVSSSAPCPVEDESRVVNAVEALKGEINPGKNVVVVGGGAVGCETALAVSRMGTPDAETVKFLLENDAETPEKIKELMHWGTRNVTVIEQFKGIGKDIGMSTRWVIIKCLRNMGVAMHDRTAVKKITGEGVLVEKEGEETFFPADTVVLAVGATPVNRLAEELKEEQFELHVTGDASSPRKVTEAIKEGFDAALLL